MARVVEGHTAYAGSEPDIAQGLGRGPCRPVCGLCRLRFLKESIT